MAEFRYAQGMIAESLQFIMAELKEFEQDYSPKSRTDYLEDRKLQKLMDRTVENVLTALIEVCGTLLTQEGITAESYVQVLSESAKRMGLSNEEQENLAKLALQRNRLTHRYLNFRWEAITMFVSHRALIKKLLEKILEREEKAK